MFKVYYLLYKFYLSKISYRSLRNDVINIKEWLLYKLDIL